MMGSIQIYHINGCARCGDNHEELTAARLNNHPLYTHYTICPTVGQPILLKITTEPGTMLISYDESKE